MGIYYVHSIPCGECQTPAGNNPYSPSVVGPCPTGGSPTNVEEAVEISQTCTFNYFNTLSGRTLATATLDFTFTASTDAFDSVSDVTTSVRFYLNADIASLDTKLSASPFYTLVIVTPMGETNTGSATVGVDITDILDDFLFAGVSTHDVTCTTTTINTGDPPVIIDVWASCSAVLAYVCD